MAEKKDGISIDLDIDSKEAVIKWLEEVQRGTGDAKPLWLAVIPKIKEFIDYELDEIQDSHKKWQKLSEKYLDAKIKKGYPSGIGVRTGLMKKGSMEQAKKKVTSKSLTWELNQNVVRSKKGYPYAMVFHYGKKDGSQPARPLFRYTMLRLNSFLKMDVRKFNDGTTHANFTYKWLRKSLESYKK